MYHNACARVLLRVQCISRTRVRVRLMQPRKMRPSAQASACKPYNFMLGPAKKITDGTRYVPIQLLRKRQVSNRQCQLMLHNDGSSRARVHYVRECVRHGVIVMSPKKVLYKVAPFHSPSTFAQRNFVQRRRSSFRPWYYSRGMHRAGAALRAAPHAPEA